MLENLKILLVGAGSMGSAMIKGWMRANVGSKHYTIVTPNEESITELREKAIIDWYEKPEKLPAEYKPDIIVFAVKPQILEKILKPYYGYSLMDSIFVTVAAGKQLNSYHKHLGSSAKIVRVMPNLPVAFGKGMSVGYAESSLDDENFKTVNDLFDSLGRMLWVDSEDDFHAVTAISGCGPAYLYSMVEALTAAGVVAGLDPHKAAIMARQTIIGAGEQLDHSKEPIDTLIKRVASPGGVTEAAIEVLEEKTTGLVQLMTRAITTGVMRSKELDNGKD